MKRSRRKIEELLWLTGLHAVARSLYHTTAGRQTAMLRDRMRTFYGTLLPSNVLVFDIGANVGVLSAIFSSLGARVIAVEPNADCVRHIQLSYADARIEVVQAVTGPRNGLATLNLSDARDDISSVSSDWIAAIQREHSDYGGLWSKQVTVPMLTLDTVIEHYGMPYFIKIDVEGFEESVLGGLSVQPSLVSFEFNAAFLPTAIRCLDMSVFADSSRFNFAMEDPARFELETWVAKQKLQEILSKMEHHDRHGDIFVKRGLLVQTSETQGFPS